MESIRGSLIAVCLLPALLSGACTHQKSKEELAKHPEEAPPKTAAAKPAESSIEAKQVAAEQEASYVTEFSFAKGRADLSAEARQRLTKILAQALARGKVEDLKIISWADSEYPSVHKKSLPSSQVKLAEKRNGAIKDFMKSLNNDIPMTAYNMAERPGVLSDLFGASNTQVKKAFEIAGIPNTETSVKRPSKASKAVVMILLVE